MVEVVRTVQDRGDAWHEVLVRDYEEARQQALQQQHATGWTLERQLRDQQAAQGPCLFCVCGAMLPRTRAEDVSQVTCLLCKSVTPLSLVLNRELVSVWRPQREVAVERSGPPRTKIAMRCVNAQCDAQTVEYYQMQLRGADEGSTTFYECGKCKTKWNENN